MWVRIDVNILDHPKLVNAAPVTKVAYIAAICYCQRHMTDGKIERGAMRSILATAEAGPEHLEELVQGELIHYDDVSKVYEVHDFLKYNPSAEEMEAKRKARADAGRKGGISSGQSRSKHEIEANASAMLERLPSDGGEAKTKHVTERNVGISSSSNSGGGKNYHGREAAASSSNGQPRPAPASDVDEKAAAVFAACPRLDHTSATEKALRRTLASHPEVDAVGQAEETLDWGVKHEAAGGHVDNWWNLYCANLDKLISGKAALKKPAPPPPETEFWEPPPEELARWAERDRLMQEHGRARGHG